MHSAAPQTEPVTAAGTAARVPPRQEPAPHALSDWSATIECLTDAFVVLDRDWRYIYLNRAAETLLGLPRARLLGEVLWQAMPVVVGTRFERQFRRAVRDKVTVEFESRRDADGRWLAVKAYPTDDGLAVLLRDVTERRRAIKALRENEVRLRLALEATGMGAFEHHFARGTIRWSPQAKRIFGFDPSQRDPDVNQWLQRIHAEDRERVRQAVDRLSETGADAQFDYRMVLPGGETRWIHGWARALFDDKGTPARAYGVCADVTARREAEEARRRSEERFRNMAEIAPGILFTTDALGMCDYINRRFYDFTGIAPGASINASWAQALHPDDRHGSGSTWQRARDSGMECRNEFRFRAADGSYRWFVAHSRPIRDAQGHILRWFGVCTDIHERKLGELALRESEARFRQLAENIQGVFFIADRGLTRVEYVSPAYESLFGASRDSLYRAPRSFLDRVLAEDRPLTAAAVARHADGAPLDMEYRVVARDGSVRWVWARSIPWHSSGGQELTAVFVEDITERKSAEDRRLGREIQQRETLVREVHHRIKNNLQGVAGLLRLSMNEYPELEPVLDAAVTQLQSVALVHGIQSRAPDARLELGEMIDAISRSMASHIHGRIVVDPPPEEMARVEFVESEAVPIALVLNELITNAAKHSDPGERTAPITIGVASSDTGARIAISNPGTLPRGFDYGSGSGLRTGLELVKLLLPPAGATLALETDSAGVKAVLELSPPVLTAITRPSRQGSES